METNGVESMLETMVFQNQTIIDHLKELTDEIRGVKSELGDIKSELEIANRELNWLETNSLASVIRDGLGNIESSVERCEGSLSSIDVNTT